MQNTKQNEDITLPKEVEGALNNLPLPYIFEDGINK